MDEYISREDTLWIASLTNAAEETKERLQNWKAADVQPVRHGRWVSPVSVGNDIKFCCTLEEQ